MNEPLKSFKVYKRGEDGQFKFWFYARGKSAAQLRASIAWMRKIPIENIKVKEDKSGVR